MSQNTLPDPQTAYGYLFDNAHAQVFFGRLGAAGIVPQSEKEAQDLLEMAGQLRHASEAEKEAGDDGSRFGGPLSALNGLLSEQGLDGPTKLAAARDHELAVKQAADMLMQDPMIYNSVLSLKAQEAATVA